MCANPRIIEKNDVLRHFDKIAEQYDRYKAANSYYYTRLKNIYKKLIPDSCSMSILELGCGSGELINFLNPKIGAGVDVSPRMIEIASKKFCHKQNLHFYTGSIDDIDFMRGIFKNLKFDYCIIPDTIEHLSDLNKACYVLSQTIDKNTSIIITWANPIWLPILEMLEILKLKMPEGPHYWPGMQEVIAALRSNSFRVLTKGFNMLFPFRLPFLSDFINRFSCSIPLLNRLCFLQYIVVKGE